MPNLWYKNAVIYCVDVETFMDGNDDGVGDFAGLAHRLDHLERLGVTCIWLNPFYPSPNRDNGYDITDYYNVDPRYGSLGDFVEFMQAAEDRGMRVIVDLVVNHTSIDHPWFQAARSDPKSHYRDWYVWSEDKPENIHEGIIFPGVQEAIWSYDKAAKAWYLHRFYDHQADLNIANPQVREEILRIMGFWLALGVYGFRVDAVPFLIEQKGIKKESHSNPHDFLSEMHDFLAWRRAGAVLLAEANIPYDQSDEFFDGGDRMSMIFDFPLNQHVMLGFARRTAAPVRRALEHRPKPGGTAQWTNFLRSHDELSLERLTIEERQECFEAFGPKPNMQIYDRGLRRRLAGMFEGDQDRLRLAYSLLFALPGTCMLWYGEEIGMSEDLSLKERAAVRTPMQWSDDQNGGFSTADAKQLVRPVREKGPFGYKEVNVSEQVRHPESLLKVISEMIATRRSAPEIGWGEASIIDVGDDELLVLRCDWRGDTVVTLHNFSEKDKQVRLELEGISRFLPMLIGNKPMAIIPADEPIKLPPLGYCWLRCENERH
ncbi:alpha-amylase family protein [Devosia sp. RR2S18]|uniref:alpha-amylase family protein n=1 Tax=Devosia rhizosphaerae TaxID=3049774 RepID=UPI0025412781|nr:alpha-amylase family protein [Devosia sp. RR2S18]WIJ26491.1 alpha-amylase family protein [Devosia sp. RR2S18]